MRPQIIVLSMFLPALVACSGSDSSSKSCEELGCATSGRECATAAGVSSCGACLGNYLETAGTCVKDKSCEDLACGDKHRTCEGSGHTIACGGCAAAYKASGDACILKTCEDLTCAADHRACNDLGGGTMACGQCTGAFVDKDGKCEACVDVDNDQNCDAADTCIDKDGDGAGVGTITGCESGVTDTDDTNPKVCSNSDGDECDDCASGHFNVTTDCCEALPTFTAGTAPSFWLDAACETGLTADTDKVLTAANERANARPLGVSVGGIKYGTVMRNGRRTLTLNGAASLTTPELPGSALFDAQAFAIFAVQYYDAEAGSVPASSLVTWGGEGSRVVAHTPWTTGQIIFDSGSPNDSGDSIGRTYTNELNGTYTLLKNWRQVSLVRNGTNATISVDGTPLATAGLRTASVVMDQLSVMQIGGLMVGSIGEVLIVKGPMSDAEVQAVEAYQRRKWLTAAPPN